MPPSEAAAAAGGGVSGLPERSEYNPNYSDNFSRRRGGEGGSRGRRRRGRVPWWWNWYVRGRIPETSFPDDLESDSAEEVAVVQNSIKSVDLQKGENGTVHHTDEYDTLNCVVRRGDPFSLQVHLATSLHERQDNIHIRLQCLAQGDVRGGPNGLRVSLDSPVDQFPDDGGSLEEWQYRILDSTSSSSTVTLQVLPPNNAVVSGWSLKAVLVDKAGKKLDSKKSREDLYVIFNPWNKADDVFLANEKEREEYVMNESGLIYSGSAFWPYPKKWAFGQFETPVLETAMSLLDKAELPPNNRRSAIHISRTISKLVNSQDDEGVLVGNWSGDYSGGRAPTSWTGSVPILEAYVENGEKPVSYGQCWVFSGVVTSILRALGVPCRSVTNFESAHDTDENMTKDVAFDENMDKIDDMNDSIWNFHVWNECWMTRPDLPAGYNGWQIIDATPQEASEGAMQLGPCPQACILDGNVYLGYDAKFVFAEVNADVVHWQWKDGRWTVLKVLTKETGTAIYTKAVGFDSHHDITNQYKKREGSDEERLAVMKAVSFGRNPLMYRVMDNLKDDVLVSVSCKDALDLIADNFTYKLNLANEGGEARTVRTKVVVRKAQYTGVGRQRIEGTVTTHTLQAGEDKQMEQLVSLGDVLKGANDECSVTVSLTAHVKETGQLIDQKLVLPIQLPPIHITSASAVVAKGDTVYVDLQVPNPFSASPLSSALFEISGPGLAKPTKLHIGTVAPNGIAGTSTSFVPFKVGKKRVLYATFSCKQFQGSRGTLDFQVTDRRNLAEN